MLPKRIKINIEKLSGEFCQLLTRDKTFQNKLPVKEIGHSLSTSVETDLLEYINKNGIEIAYELDKSGNKKSRAISDGWVKLYPRNLINVKFGLNRDGQPNAVAMMRLFNEYVKNESLDSYYLLKVVYDKESNQCYCVFFDMLENLHLFTYDQGTGQIMLKERALKTAVANSEINEGALSYDAKVDNLRAMYLSQGIKHIKLKIKQLLVIAATSEERNMILDELDNFK